MFIHTIFAVRIEISPEEIKKSGNKIKPFAMPMMQKNIFVPAEIDLSKFSMPGNASLFVKAEVMNLTHYYSLENKDYVQEMINVSKAIGPIELSWYSIDK
jgi:hypothetical protein